VNLGPGIGADCVFESELEGELEDELEMLGPELELKSRPWVGGSYSSPDFQSYFGLTARIRTQNAL